MGSLRNEDGLRLVRTDSDILANAYPRGDSRLLFSDEEEVQMCARTHCSARVGLAQNCAVHSSAEEVRGNLRAPVPV